MAWITLRTFNRARFSVALQWQPEDYIDLSGTDSEERAALADGTLTSCCFRVVVLLDGHEVGASYLGDSRYETPAEFAQEHRSGPSYFSDMVREACGFARDRLHVQRQAYVRRASW